MKEGKLVMKNKRAVSVLAGLILLVLISLSAARLPARADTLTPTPGPRWGVYVPSSPATWMEDWLAVVPEEWHNPDQASAKYAIEIVQVSEDVETCDYFGGYSVVRRRIDVQVTATDLETGASVASTVLAGTAPRACSSSETFTEGQMMKAVYGDMPSPLTADWVIRALHEQPGLAVLPPTPTPTPRPTLTPRPTSTLAPTVEVASLAQQTVEHNADWQPYTQVFDGVKMVMVPAGCFMMGSSAGQDDENPVHEVCFDHPFWIDRIEVSNEQFDDLGGLSAAQWPTFPDHPVTYITWAEASVYCASRGGRLPTEAEWEYAARGPDDLRFPWGNEFSADNIVYAWSSYGNTEKVGSKPSGVSWVGALDLSGNVSEWVADWYGSYSPGSQTDPTGPTSGDGRVRRGGSWADDEIWVTAAVRLSYPPDYTNSDLGFRCARDYGG